MFAHVPPCVVVSIVAGMLCLPAAVSAELPDTLPEAHARISELEAQVRHLQAELALLRSELASLRAPGDGRDAAATVAVSEPANHGTLADAADATPADDAAPDIVVATEPVAAERRKPYGSSHEILRDMPADLQRHPQTGWDRLTVHRSVAWLRTAAVDHPYDGREIISAVTIQLNPSRGLTPNAAEYLVTVRFEPRTFDYRGETITHRLHDIRMGADEAFARRARTVKAGMSVRVTGRITGVDPQYLGTAGLRTQMFISIADATIHHRALTP
jgi:hypothetical protein